MISETFAVYSESFTAFAVTVFRYHCKRHYKVTNIKHKRHYKVTDTGDRKYYLPGYDVRAIQMLTSLNP